LDFVSLERIVIVASMNPSSTIGRHPISTRFTANVRVVYMDYAIADELLPVYSSYMKTILSHPRFGGGAMAQSSKRLSNFLIDLYTNVRSKFTVDEHRHYLFTPRNITYMIFSILRYEIPEAQSLIEIMIYESSRIYRDRLVDGESGKRFDNVLYTLLKNHLKYPTKLQDTYFLSKIVQGTPSLLKGLPSMGKIMRKDYTVMIDTAKRAYEREYKELDMHLIDEVLDLIAF
jgi:dynein heavy chain 2